jgi:hypothetical protein
VTTEQVVLFDGSDLLSIALAEGLGRTLQESDPAAGSGARADGGLPT